MARPLLLLVPLGLLLAARRRPVPALRPEEPPGPSLRPSPRRPSPEEQRPFGDSRRLRTLDALLPSVRPEFEALIREADRRGFRARIVSAVRTCAEQGNLAGTRARRSWHPLGRAVDLEFDGASSADYESLGEWWEARGGVWGGRWTTLYPVAPCGPPDRTSGDPCHFQWTPGTERVPATVWPEGEACADVAQRYLSAHGARWTPAGGWAA